jgi:hypothetical protein
MTFIQSVAHFLFCHSDLLRIYGFKRHLQNPVAAARQSAAFSARDQDNDGALRRDAGPCGHGVFESSLGFRISDQVMLQAVQVK